MAGTGAMEEWGTRKVKFEKKINGRHHHKKKIIRKGNNYDVELKKKRETK